MDWIGQAVREFGDTLGIGELHFDARDGLELALDSGEIIGFAYSSALASEEMLIYASAPLVFDPLPQMEAALRLSNARHAGAPYLRAAIVAERLVLALRLDARAVNLPVLDESVWRLIDMQHEAAN